MAETPIFVKHITLRNGKVIYASDYGKRAFAIYPKDKKPESELAETQPT